MHLPGPRSVSSLAVRSQSFALRLEMYTLAPAATKPEEIMPPIPLAPPVTSTTFPETSNSCFVSMMRRSAEVQLHVMGLRGEARSKFVARKEIGGNGCQVILLDVQIQTAQWYHLI